MTPTLFLSTLGPRVTGLRGTLAIETIDVERVAALFARRYQEVSLITFQSTCDVLAVLAGRPGIHRHNKDRDNPDLTMRNGDLWLQVSIRDDRRNKNQNALGAFDFNYTLCVFQETESGC